ncbi:MAG: High-affnity carbon uptake protein Hat/HatR, partial [Chthonomonadales bacterium]|nr:High-affnity carbon uptake protein Hat/HatR [Chthonomonadales bacterium]
SDLIQDTRMSPFNIGRRVLLTDFTPQEAAPLAIGLAPAGRTNAGQSLLGRVLYWTGGHPYMTQRLCRVLAEKTEERPHSLLTVREVDKICRQLFLSKQAQDTDDNMAFVRNRLLRSEVDLAALLDMYRQVRSGRRVTDDETNPLCAVLRLAGIVRAESGEMQIRNRIYDQVFDSRWVQNHMPDAELRRQRAAYRRGALRAAFVGGAVAAIFVTLAALARRQTIRANGWASDARKAASATRKALHLAGDRLTALQTAQEKLRGALASADTAARDARAAQGEANLKRQEAEIHKATALAARKETEKKKQQLQSLLSRKYAADAQAHLDADDGMGAVAPLLTAMNLDRDDPRRMEMHARRLAMTVEGIPRLTRLFACGAPVVWAAFSPGERLMAAAAGREVRIWDVATGRALPVLRHTAFVKDAVFSPDGTRLASACADGKVTVWNIATGKPTLPTLTCPGRVRRILWSGNGALLTAGHDCGDEVKYSATIWDADTGKMRYQVDMLYSCCDLAFTPDSRRLIVAASDNSFEIRDAETGKQQRGISLMFGGDRPSIVFSPDQKRFLLRGSPGGGSGSNARLFDLKTGQRVTPAFRCSGPSCYSPDGKWLAVADDLDVQILEGETGKAQKAHFHLDGPITALAFSPDGASLLTASGDGSVRVWDVATGKLALPRMRHAGPVRTAMFDRSGRHILAAGDDGTVRLWDLTPAHALRDLAWLPVNLSLAGTVNIDLPVFGRILSAEIGPGRPIGRLRLWDLKAGHVLTEANEEGARWIGSGISLSADARRVLLRGEDAQHGMVTQILDVRTGRPVSPLIHYAGRSLKDVLEAKPPGLSPDGRRYLIAAGAQRSELRDAVTGGTIHTFECPLGNIKFCADGTRLLVCLQNMLQVQSAENGEIISRYCLSRTGLIAFDLSAHGRFLACTDENGRLTVRDAVTGNVRLNASVFPSYGKRFGQPGFFPGGFHSSADEQRLVAWTRDGWALIDTVHPRIVKQRPGLLTPDSGSQITFRPDGKRLLTIDLGNTVLWDANSGEALVHLRSGVGTSHFSPDGKQIAWTVDNHVLLYNTDTGKLEHSLEHPGMISPPWPGTNPCVWFNSDGRLLLTNSTDGMARLWDPVTGERVGPPIPMPTADGMAWFVDSDRLLLAPSVTPGKIATDPPAHLVALPPPVHSKHLAELLARLSAPPALQDGDAIERAWRQLQDLQTKRP